MLEFLKELKILMEKHGVEFECYEENYDWHGCNAIFDIDLEKDGLYETVSINDRHIDIDLIEKLIKKYES